MQQRCGSHMWQTDTHRQLSDICRAEGRAGQGVGVGERGRSSEQTKPRQRHSPALSAAGISFAVELGKSPERMPKGEAFLSFNQLKN